MDCVMCYGALSGHMELYKIVKPELDKLPDQDPKETAALDAEQLKAGQEYLALYKRAMEAAEKASPQPINARGGQAVKAGGNIWSPALQAESQDPHVVLPELGPARSLRDHRRKAVRKITVGRRGPGDYHRRRPAGGRNDQHGFGRAQTRSGAQAHAEGRSAGA